MSVLRQANLLGQQRLDIPHIRAIESSVAADFDLLAGQIMAGKNPLVVIGFDVAPISNGTAASSAQIRVAGAVIMHPEASENGTIFSVPSTRANETLNAANTRVQGGFTASNINYIGLDLRRSADATTADLVQFLDPDTNLEKPKTVPLGRTLDYVIVISTQDFSTTPGIAPLAKITTDQFNNVTAVEDARNFFMRLGAGGTITDPQSSYTWPGGRGEAGDNSDFNSGDKVIHSLKEWMDAIMTRIWEVGGGEYWYSASADRNVKLLRQGTTFANGDWFSWDSTNLLWRGLTIVFDNSTGFKNEIKDQLVSQPGLTNLADGECIYVDLDRTQNRSGLTALIPVKSTLSTLSYPSTPGSRYVLAWRSGTGAQAISTREAQFPVNASFTIATTSAAGIVQLDATAVLSGGNPLVYTDGSRNQANKIAALDGSRQVIGTGLQRDTSGAMAIGSNGNVTGLTIGQLASTTAATIEAQTFTFNANNASATAWAVSIGLGGSQFTTAKQQTYLSVSTIGLGNGACVFKDAAPQQDVRYIAEFFSGTLGDTEVLGITDFGAFDILETPPATVVSTPTTSRAKLYLTNNGLAGGSGKRQQLVIKWVDGSTTIIAESPEI